MSHPPLTLILAAHGSESDDQANRPMHALANRVENLLQQRLQNSSQVPFEIESVTPAFLAGDPLMTHVLDRIDKSSEHKRAIIVPVMTSRGYYLKKLPEKFAANSSFQKFDLWITDVLGLDKQIGPIITRKIETMMESADINCSNTTVVLIGHGTRKNKTSCLSTYELAEQLKQELSLEADGLEVCFLDQDPHIEDIAQKRLRNQARPNTLLVPFLISRGPHLTEDVTQAFGLATGPSVSFPLAGNTEFGGKILCAGPIAEDPGIENIVCDLAQAALRENTRLPLAKEVV